MKSNETSTQTIWDMLNNGASPSDIEALIDNTKTFADYMNEYLASHPDLTPAQITRNADLARSYASEILTGKKKGSRDRIIAICYGAGMNLDEVMHALTYSGNDPLYPKRKRDAYISYIFNNIKSFPSITDVNLFLSDRGEEPLSTSKGE
ncbi:MAG: hypothetical protein E7298_06320 [Lachnospiraceae bacterium]|nr:hypothetical protein [Lachnospiraceae bacterium]